MNRAAIEAALQICMENCFVVVSGGNRYDAEDILSYVRKISDYQLEDERGLMRKLMIEILWEAEAAIQIARQNGGADAVPTYKAIIAACRAALR